MPNPNIMEFIMRLRKVTKHKACFTENMDRIGKLYLPLALLAEMNINDEIIIQIAPGKNYFPPETGSYITSFFYEKETVRKVRFKENISEKGELDLIYINKDILEEMGLKDEISVRVTPCGTIGSAAFAK